MKNIHFIVIILFFIIHIVFQIRCQKISIKDSFWWFLFSTLLLLFMVLPGSIEWFVEFFDIEIPSFFIFSFCIAFLLFINFNYGKKLSEQQMKIIKLSQTISLLQEKVDSMKEKED